MYASRSFLYLKIENFPENWNSMLLWDLKGETMARRIDHAAEMVFRLRVSVFNTLGWLSTKIFSISFIQKWIFGECSY